VKILNKRLDIGILCLVPRHSAATIQDHLWALTTMSRHYSHKFNLLDVSMPCDAINKLDVLVVHYSITLKDEEPLRPNLRNCIKEFPGVKVVFIQDEYRFIDATVDALAELGIDLLFTCVPVPEIEKVYPVAKLPNLRKINVLTGYVSPDILGRPVKPFADRPIDVGYRGRKVPEWLGRLGWEKYYISERFAQDAPRYGLNVDIKCGGEYPICGKAWTQFVGNCKAVLGAESGASIVDFTGEIQAKTDSCKLERPEASFDELQALFFAEEERKASLNQISPRCFEAAALRTLMILYEGEYSGILKSWRHYVPLKKDHSNMDEVVDVLRDPARAEAILQVTYDEIATNPAYSFQALTDLFDSEVSRAAMKKCAVANKKWQRANYELIFDRFELWLICIKARALASIIGALSEISGAIRDKLTEKKGTISHLLQFIERYPKSIVTNLVSILFNPMVLTVVWRSGNRRLRNDIYYINDILFNTCLYRSIGWLLARFFPLLPKAVSGARRNSRSVIFLHNSYYHFYFLARELRRRGWDAISVSLDEPSSAQSTLFHGEDVNLFNDDRFMRRWNSDRLIREIASRMRAIHFHGVGMMHINPELGDSNPVEPRVPEEFLRLKRAGVKIGYSLVGCNDGVSQTLWNKWTGGMCHQCRFMDLPGVCSDLRNLSWGSKLISVCDIVSGELMPRLDFLKSSKVVTVPLTYCVDEATWHPDIVVPDHYRLEKEDGEVIVVHAVGNFVARSEGGADPKGTGAIKAAVERLRAEGMPVRLHFFHSIPSRDMKFIQVQADIVVDQLLFGRYGAQARECLMLGKPVVGNLKWTPAEEDEETSACLSECPIIHATQDSVYEVLKDLAASPEKRAEIGRRSRAYALHWHSIAAIADRFEREYARRLGIGEDHGRRGANAK